MTTLIKKLEATAGFLENAKIEFSEGLNCIIGSRGTCKSTIVESNRFAFDRGGRRIEELAGKSDQPGSRMLPHFGMIKATLGSGSIRCAVM
jgi:hypothetical protein